MNAISQVLAGGGYENQVAPDFISSKESAVYPFEVPASDKPLSAHLPDLFSLTVENMRKVSRQAASQLGTLFREAGIATTPAVNFSFDDAGAISVTGTRSNLPQIRALIEAHPEVADSLQCANALASHLQAILKTMKTLPGGLPPLGGVWQFEGDSFEMSGNVKGTF